MEFASERFGTFDYLGTYAQSDSGIAFNFADSDLAGPWMATARLRGDTMIVAYNNLMGLADFMDGRYAR